MTERVVLHVGSPKSGTTYLQGVLEQNRELLARAGVLVVGRTHLERVHAAFAVRDDPRLDTLPAGARGAWQRLVDEIRGWQGRTAVLSYELLSVAGEEQAARALADLTGLEVHVVVTAKDFGSAVPSAWQERLKFALTTPLEEWSPRPESAPRAEWGWRTLDPAGVADRWGATLPPDRVHVVTTPRQGGHRHELWRRFATAAGLPDLPGLDLEAGSVPANASLGVRSAEVLRRVNELVEAPLDTNREQALWLRDTLAHQVLAPADDEPIGATDAQHAAALALSEASMERIRAAGYDVVGDLEDLRATRRDARTPGSVPADELLPIALRAVVDLLLRLRAATPPTDRPPDRRPDRRQERPDRPRSGGPDREPRLPAAEVRRRLLSRLARPSRTPLDEAHHRLDELERTVQENRHLHQRVAMLTDLVSELLLPAGDRDVDVPAEALRRYRKENL